MFLSEKRPNAGPGFQSGQRRGAKVGTSHVEVRGPLAGLVFGPRSGRGVKVVVTQE